MDLKQSQHPLMLMLSAGIVCYLQLSFLHACTNHPLPEMRLNLKCTHREWEYIVVTLCWSLFEAE